MQIYPMEESRDEKRRKRRRETEGGGRERRRGIGGRERIKGIEGGREKEVWVQRNPFCRWSVMVL